MVLVVVSMVKKWFLRGGVVVNGIPTMCSSVILFLVDLSRCESRFNHLELL